MYRVYRVHEMLRVHVLEMYSAHVYVPYHLYRVQPFAIVWAQHPQANVAVARVGFAKIEGPTAARSEAS